MKLQLHSSPVLALDVVLALPGLVDDPLPEVVGVVAPVDESGAEVPDGDPSVCVALASLLVGPGATLVDPTPGGSCSWLPHAISSSAATNRATGWVWAMVGSAHMGAG